MPKNKKKVTFSGSLAWRTSLVCLFFLIIPLLIHTFLLYRQEIEIMPKQELILRISAFFVIVPLFGGALVIWFVRKLSKPLDSLCQTMKRVAEGALHSRYLPQKWGFEINTIGLMFNEVLDEMLLFSREMEEEKLKRIQLVEELKLGREIQASLLPKLFPTMHPFEISAGCIPAEEVGGDFYDIFPLGDNKTLIAVADVSGKGISACLFSLGLRSSLRALAANIDSLPEIVKEANELFLSDAEQSSNFATLWIGLLEKRKLTYISLGHPPALLKRNNKLQELTSTHPALGLLRYEKIKPASIDLEIGDEVLIYSDGATDARDEKGKRFGPSRLKEAFASCHTADEMLATIQNFSQGAPAQDDLTLLFIVTK